MKRNKRALRASAGVQPGAGAGVRVRAQRAVRGQRAREGCDCGARHLHKESVLVLSAPSRGGQAALAFRSVLHSKSVLYCTFVWARRALNRPFRRFTAWAVMTDMTDPQEELGRDGYSSEDGDGTGTCAGTCEHSWYCRYLEYQETTLGKLVAGALLLMVLMSLGTCMAAICCHPHMSHGKAVGTYNFGGKKDKWQFEPPPSNPCFGPHIPQGADWEASGAQQGC